MECRTDKHCLQRNLSGALIQEPLSGNVTPSQAALTLQYNRNGTNISYDHQPIKHPEQKSHTLACANSERKLLMNHCWSHQPWDTGKKLHSSSQNLLLANCPTSVVLNGDVRCLHRMQSFATCVTARAQI